MCGTVLHECVSSRFFDVKIICVHVCIPIHKQYDVWMRQWNSVHMYVCVLGVLLTYNTQYKSFISSMKFVRYKQSAPKIEHKQNAVFKHNKMHSICVTSVYYYC